jgi:hypothetical protein
MTEIASLEDYLALFHESVHDRLTDLLEPSDEGYVVVENQDFWASRFGERTARIVGPTRGIPTITACEGRWIGDLPSRRQYADAYWRQPNPTETQP